MLSALLTALTRHHARARAIAILERFDDHRLRDIGIARDQIEMFVAGKIGGIQVCATLPRGPGGPRLLQDAVGRVVPTHRG